MRLHSNYINSCFTLFVFAFLLYTPSLKAEYFFKNINTDQGLSSNSVNAIFRDSQGYLWIGTNYGLNRFDGVNMKVFKADMSNATSLKNNYVTSIVQDKDGVLWIRTGSGYTTFDYPKEYFNQDCAKQLKDRNIKLINSLWNVFCGKNSSAFIIDDFSVSLYNHVTKRTVSVQKTNTKVEYVYGCFDSHENFWVIDTRFILYKVNCSSGRIEKIYNSMQNGNKTGNSILFVDKRDNVWIARNSADLFFFDKKSDKLFNFNERYPTAPYNSYPIRSITEDRDNKIWIGTDHGGISIIDGVTFNQTQIQVNENQPSSLSGNSIISVYADAEGIVWVGHYKQGVDYYHPHIKRFVTLKIPGSSANNDINCFTEDSDNNLWIGTNGRGLFKYVKKTKQYEVVNYSVDPKKRDNTVVSLLTDSKGRIWIATFLDGLYCYDNKKITHYTMQNTNLPDNNIWSLLEDSSHTIWVGTLTKGLFRFDEKKGVFEKLNAIQSSGSCIETAFKDKQNELWFGTSWGIYHFSAKGKIKRIFEFNKNNDKFPERNYINSITQDKKGYYWIATQSGLAVMNGKNDKYHFFNEKEGIDNTFVYMVIVDSNNNIWISTTVGLYMLKVLDYGDIENIKTHIVRFGKNDGLQDNKFNSKSAYFTKDNKLIFAGVNGYNIIDPKSLQYEKTDTRLVFTNLYVNNKLVSIGEELSGRVLLKQSLAYTSKIILKYNESTLGIGFSAINFLHPEKYTYEYQLKGFDDNWVTLDASTPTAVYNNLSRGNYTFNVRAKDGGDFRDDKMISLEIEVLPPFWLGWPAFLFYFVIVLALVIYIYRILVDRATFRLRMGQELQEKKHIEEISAMKVKFFTNLSHELRTPVSLIMLPIENMLVKTVDPAIRNNLTMVLRNAKRLLFIVNQLLDFRKLEVGEITYHPVLGDIVAFIKDVTLPFMDISQNKNVKLTVRSNVEELYTSFDPNKLERILFNLLSNAFKFTGNRGAVDVSVIYDETQELPITIKISDTGIGIDRNKISNIFKPFYQAENQGDIANMGTGIGLSITYEFVRLHQGTINVESEVDKGTTFIIHLPMNENSVPALKEDLPEEEIVTHYDNSKSHTIDNVVKKSKTILIVDDNDDFRFYLVENLRSLYNVIEANNGVIAFEKANRFSPDIIVSDVTMPLMTGYELCEKLKTDVNTSHIPVILLTANMLDEDKIVGFEAGADEYITKPFNVGVLQARIRNLLNRKDEQRVRVNEQMGTNISEVHLPSLDEKLLEKVIKITNEKLDDTGFGVEELSKMIGMSSVYLNKKMSALTGKTTSEYVRSIRLRKAAQLLERTDKTISEVAYEVGYNSPKYFSKYFKDEFGILPSEYRKNYM